MEQCVERVNMGREHRLGTIEIASTDGARLLLQLGDDCVYVEQLVRAVIDAGKRATRQRGRVDHASRECPRNCLRQCLARYLNDYYIMLIERRHTWRVRLRRARLCRVLRHV